MRIDGFCGTNVRSTSKCAVLATARRRGDKVSPLRCRLMAQSSYCECPFFLSLLEVKQTSPERLGCLRLTHFGHRPVFHNAVQAGRSSPYQNTDLSSYDAAVA